MQSPVYNKPADIKLTTIGEENTTAGEGEHTFCVKLNMACGNPNNPIPRTMSETGGNSGNLDNRAFDINGIDWFAQQNGNQFDPQLFGDYREPQENILAGEPFSDNFFTEAFALPDFNSPFNVAPSPVPPKKNLVAQIDEKQNEEDEVVPGEDRATMLNCNTIWYVSLRPHRMPCGLWEKITNYLSGIACKLARRLRRANSTSTFFARICKRRPSAPKPVQWSTNRTSTRL
jgi:AP-1-like factor